MAVLKKIKFGKSTNNIAKTIVNGAPEGVIAVTNSNNYQNTDSEDKDYSYDIDVRVDDATIVKDGETNKVLKVGTVPAAQVSVADSGDLFDATNVEAALAELKDNIAEVGGAAKSYKIVEVASPASSTSLKEYKVQVAVGTGEFVDDTASATIVVPKDNAFVTAQLGHVGATADASTGVITDGSGEDALLIEYVNGSGVYTLVAVPIGAFLKEAEFKDGLQVTNGEVSAKLGQGLEFGGESGENQSIKVKVDSTSESFLSVGANGVKVSGVQDAINSAIDALDFSDTEADGQYVSKVSETDGKISVARANVSEAVLNNYAKGTVGTAVAATDTINEAFSKIEVRIDNNEQVTSAALNEIKTNLDTEIAARKAVDGQNGQTYAANASTNYISGATSLNDADVKLDDALKAEETRAKAAESEIADKVGLTGVEGSRTFTPTTNYGTGSTTVVDNMQKIDTALKAVSDKAGAIQYKVDGTTLEFFGMTAHA